MPVQISNPGREGSMSFQAELDDKPVLAAADRILKKFKEIQDISKGLGKSTLDKASFTALNNAQLHTQTLLRQSRLELQKLKIEEQQLVNANAKVAGSVDELNRKFAENRLKQQELRMAMAATRASQTAAAGSYKEAQQRLKQLGDQIRSVSGGFEATGKIQRARIAEYTQLNDRLKKFDATLGNHQRNVGNYRSALSGVGSELRGMVSGYLSAAAAIGAATAAFNQSLKADAVRSSLEFTFGSVDLADAKLEELLDTANRLGINYNALTDSYKSFTGAVVASNFDFAQGEKIFNAVAGAASRLKLSSEDTEGALRALQQMISKGNVQAEELRGQLGERIPGAFSIAARAMGVTETKLNDMLQKGEVLAADLLPKLANELEKTFDTNTTEKIEGLSAAWQRFITVFTGSVSENSNISSFFASLLDGVTGLTSGLAKLVNSTSWAEFWARMTTANGSGDAIRNVRDSYDRANRAINAGNNMNTGDPKQVKTTYQELSLAYKEATAALEEYKKRVADGTMTNKGKVTIQGLTRVVDALGAKLFQVQKILPKEKPIVAVKEISEADKKAIERKAKQEIDARNKLQKEIDQIADKSRRKQLSEDEQEIAAIEAKYKAIEDKIAEYRAKGNRLPIDTGKLPEAKRNEIAVARYDQETEKLKASLEEQKELYAEFEEYKGTIGVQKAKEQFKSRIDTEKTYLQRLEEEREKIAKRYRIAGNPTALQSGFEFSLPLTEGEEKRLANLNKLIEAEKAIEQKRFLDLIAGLQSYEEQRLTIQNKFAQQRAMLTTESDKAALDIKEKEELNNLDDGNAKKLDAYKNLYEGIENLSNRAADVVIANAKDMLARLIAEGKISADLAKDIAKQLENVTGNRKSRLPEQLRKMAGDIQNVASAVSGIDEQFAKVLNTIGDIVGSVGNLKASISDIGKANKNKDVLGMLSGGLGAAGAVIGAVKSVVSLFDKSEERRARAAEQQKYAQDLQMKAINAQTQALQRQLDLIKDIYGAERIEKFGKSLQDLTAKESELTTSLSGRYKLTGDAGLDKILGKVNNGVGLNQIENQIFKAVKDLGIFVGKIDGLSLEELLGLADEGKLDEQTAAIVANIQTVKKQINETQNALRADVTGTTFTGIADEIVEMFSRGNAAAEDFGRNFEEIMKRSILSSFKRNALEKELQKFYEDFAEKAESGGGLDDNEIDALRIMYDGIIANSQKQFKEMEKATGISFNPDASPGGSGNSIAGAIRGASQESIDLLAGQMGGFKVAQIETLNTNRQILELNKQCLNWAVQNLQVAMKIESNTGRTADNTDSIKADIAGINRQMGTFINTLAANGRRI